MPVIETHRACDGSTISFDSYDASSFFLHVAGFIEDNGHAFEEEADCIRTEEQEPKMIYPYLPLHPCTFILCIFLEHFLFHLHYCNWNAVCLGSLHAPPHVSHQCAVLCSALPASESQ